MLKKLYTYMKYLNKRDEFLKKSIIKINEYKSLDKKINEEYDNAGPFSNDIPWGNSLLGRLVNSVIRKAKIGYNLIRINQVCQRLRDAFEELLGESAVNKLSKEQLKEYHKVMIFSFIDSLQNAVENGYKVGIIKRLTDEAIKSIKDYEDFENKEKLIKQLEAFRKFLDQFDDNEGSDDPSITDEKGDDKDKDKDKNKDTGNKERIVYYNLMLNNLRALSSSIHNYKNVEIINQKKSATQSSTNTTLGQKNTNINTKTNVPTGKEKTNVVSEAFGDGGSPERAKINPNETHLIESFNKLKKAFEVLESPKDKGIGITTQFLNNITGGSIGAGGNQDRLDSNKRKVIESLYVEINRYLVGDKKATLQDKEALYKESIEIISDKNKRIIVAEKIARFAKRALQFDKEGLYGGLGDLGTSLEKFVESLKKLMNMPAPEAKPIEDKPVEAKPEAKPTETTEKMILNYNSFILVKEAEEARTEAEASTPLEGEVSEPKTLTVAQKIKDYWDKNIDVKEYMMDRTEADKTRANLEEISKSDDIIIKGMDPIIEIVKIFNRAYKLHTTQVIPTGRSGGQVSNSVFREYICFGDGVPESAGARGGPYRNIAIFNKWEDTVKNIIRETKYQKIFREETVIKTEEGNIIKDAGKNLRKFMTDMLDGDDLYKTGKGESGQGQQAKFLDKYFGYVVKDPNTLGYKDDVSNNSTVANEIKDINLIFSKDPIAFKDYTDLKGTFFALINKKQDGFEPLYFYIQDIGKNFAYVSYCRSFYFFKKYINESGTGTVNIEKGDLPAAIIQNQRGREANEDYHIKGTKIKLTSLMNNEGKTMINGKYIIDYITKYKDNHNDASINSTLKEHKDNFNITSYLTLCQKNDEDKLERFKLNKNIFNVITRNGGFKDIIASAGIKEAEMKKA